MQTFAFMIMLTRSPERIFNPMLCTDSIIYWLRFPCKIVRYYSMLYWLRFPCKIVRYYSMLYWLHFPCKIVRYYSMLYWSHFPCKIVKYYSMLYWSRLPCLSMFNISWIKPLFFFNAKKSMQNIIQYIVATLFPEATNFTIFFHLFFKLCISKSKHRRFLTAYPINAEWFVQHLLSERLRLSA